MASSLALPSYSAAQSPATAAPYAGNFSAVQQKMAELIQKKEIAGAVTIVVTPQQVLYLDAVGESNRETRTPMQTNTIFWIASMTKPLAGLAICKLQEEGKLDLEDPVSKFIPEFKELKDKQGQPVNVTIKQLLNHTSGLQEPKAEEVVDARVLADLIPIYVSKPVNFKPGSEWRYSQASINTAGRIVEILTEKPFEEYLSEEFFQPLKMINTTFYLSPEQLQRLAIAYRRTDEGELEVEPKHRLLHGKKAEERDRPPYPNMGLFSTAPDYGRLCRMLLNEGELDGRRYLKPETVQLFRTINTTDEHKTGFTPGNGWGVGTCVVREPQGITERLSPGTFGHGGAYGTQAWIDPERKIAWVLMVQRSNFANADASDVRKAFQDVIFPTAP